MLAPFELSASEPFSPDAPDGAAALSSAVVRPITAANESSPFSSAPLAAVPSVPSVCSAGAIALRSSGETLPQVSSIPACSAYAAIASLSSAGVA